MTSGWLDTAGKVTQAAKDGEMLTGEANRQLDDFKVRGGFDRTGFTGYDYQDQRWITVAR